MATDPDILAREAQAASQGEEQIGEWVGPQGSPYFGLGTDGSGKRTMKPRPPWERDEDGDGYSAIPGSWYSAEEAYKFRRYLVREGWVE